MFIVCIGFILAVLQRGLFVSYKCHGEYLAIYTPITIS